MKGPANGNGISKKGAKRPLVEERLVVHIASITFCITMQLACALFWFALFRLDCQLKMLSFLSVISFDANLLDVYAMDTV